MESATIAAGASGGTTAGGAREGDKGLKAGALGYIFRDGGLRESEMSEIVIGYDGSDSSKSAGVDAKVELINEHPHDALITAGDKHDARMIVVGSHGDHPVVGAIIGATPYKPVQMSDRPVLVVRA